MKLASSSLVPTLRHVPKAHTRKIQTVLHKYLKITDAVRLDAEHSGGERAIYCVLCVATVRCSSEIVHGIVYCV